MFDQRLFAGPAGAKTYACFVRHYDAIHLARHPKQKVNAMTLLVTAENPPEEKTTNYSFRLGVKYRHRSGNFNSSGYCNHVGGATKSASAVASIAKAAGSMWRCRKMTNPPSSALSGS